MTCSYCGEQCSCIDPVKWPLTEAFCRGVCHGKYSIDHRWEGSWQYSPSYYAGRNAGRAEREHLNRTWIEKMVALNEAYTYLRNMQEKK